MRRDSLPGRTVATATVPDVEDELLDVLSLASLVVPLA